MSEEKFEDDPWNNNASSNWEEYGRLIAAIRNEHWTGVDDWIASEKTSTDEKRRIMLTRSKDYVFATSRAIPFHWACFFEAPDEILLKFIDLGGKDIAVQTDDNYGSNSLIWAVINRVSLDVVKKLVSLKADLPIMTTSQSGDNALHMACRFDQDLAVIKHLVRTGAPFDIVHQRNKEFGELPIHVASSNHMDVRVIQLLLNGDDGGDEETVKDKDGEGLSPLIHAYRDGAPPEIVEFLMNKYTKYQKGDNIVQVRHETALQMMKWASKQDGDVLKQFLSRPFVRKILNNYFIRPLYLGTLMCDLYVQIALVWVYTNINQEIILGSEMINSFGLAVLYFGSAWRILREILQMLSIPLNLYVRDIWNYLDLLLIHFTVRSAFFFSHQHPLTGYEAGILTIATGFVWFHFILVLSNLRYEVCVFVFALQNVVLKLFPFYITSLIIVFSFGNMFYIANVIDNKDCEREGANEGFLCTLPESYFTTFTMLLDGNWIKFNDPVVRLPTILSFFFAIIIGLLLLNILIAEIGNAYAEMRGQSSISFWANRLNFISEISFGISIFPCAIGEKLYVPLEDTGRMKRYNFDDKIGMYIYKDITVMMRNGAMTEEEKNFFLWWNSAKNMATPPLYMRLKIFLRRSWYYNIIVPGRAFERILSGKDVESRAYIPRIVSYILTPIIWFFLAVFSSLGLVTFGLTWPQRLKQYLFFGPEDLGVSLESDVSVVKEKMTHLESKIDHLESKIDQLLLGKSGGGVSISSTSDYTA